MLRRLGTLLRVSCALAGAALFLAYATGRLLTDRTHPTQYLFWTPSLAYAAGLLLLALLGAAARARRRQSDRRTPRAWWRYTATLLALVLVHIAWSEWRAPRYIFPPRALPNAPTLRVMHWNMTYAVPYWWDRYIAGLLKAPRPDVLIVTNPTFENDLDVLATALGPDYTARRCGVFAVFTRLPILGTGHNTLAIPADFSGRARPPGMGDDADDAPRTDFLPEWSPIPRTGSNVYDPGHTMYARLDATTLLGREIVIWGVDLPSQPRSWRMHTARAAAQRLDTLHALPPTDRYHFPIPDIIVGDCNTPRGSASLRWISRGYPHAFDQCGRGHVASWPRKHAVFHIDHIFIAPGLRAASYRTLDLGISEHRGQTAEIQALP